MTKSPQDIWAWHKESFRKSKLSFIRHPNSLFVRFRNDAYVSVEDVLATVTIYKDYRGPIAKTIDGQVEKIDISHVGTKTSARINAHFVSSDGQTYDIHLINGDKRIANYMRHHEAESYTATLSFDKHGKPVYISKFWE